MTNNHIRWHAVVVFATTVLCLWLLGACRSTYGQICQEADRIGLTSQHGQELQATFRKHFETYGAFVIDNEEYELYPNLELEGLTVCSYSPSDALARARFRAWEQTDLYYYDISFYEVDVLFIRSTAGEWQIDSMHLGPWGPAYGTFY